MKLFVFEYATAGGDGGEAFLKEGKLMLSSLLADLRNTPDISTSTILSRDVRASQFSADSFLISRGNLESYVDVEIKNADAVWIIAPESDGLLEGITARAEEMGKQIVGSSSHSIALCANKLVLYEKLKGAIKMPETVLYNGETPFAKAVIKPIDGVGSASVYLLNKGDVIPLAKNRIATEFIEGETLSAGVISNGNEFELLGTCSQDMQLDGQRYFSKDVKLIEYKNTAKLTDMIMTIIKNIDGLRGYWGIDFIESDGEIYLIEINPRLTTSYPLYSKALSGSLARKILSQVIKKTAEDS